jgi:ligand-binding sensor domain-containing protein/AraC-like DNA-binding protein
VANVRKSKMGRRLYPGSTWQLLVYAIIVQLFCCHIWGLDPHKTVDQYLVDKWEMFEGIPSNTVLSITQTPYGYLWIGTSKGLVRFDGMTFVPIRFGKNEEINSQEIRHLVIDREGFLWIGGSGCLTSYRFQTGQFKTFTKNDGITRDGIRRIKNDMRGNTWISFNTSYVNRFSFSNGKFIPYNATHGLEGKKINAIVEDRNGYLLFGSRENGVFIYKEGKFFKYPLPGLDNVLIITMHIDRDGNLWIGTNNGLFRVTGGNRVTGKNIRKYTSRDGLSNDWITSITEDSGRNLWIGTAQGLNRMKKKQDGTVGFERLLIPFPINCFFEDKEKSLWIGTDNSGIRRLKDGKFKSYEPFAPHPEEIPLSLFEDRRGDTWVGTFDGKLFRCRGNEFIESLVLPGLSGTGILSIGEDTEGNLWLGTNGKGVFQKAVKTHTPGAFLQLTAREGLADDTVTSILRDSRGNLWFSTLDGISRYNNSTLESFNSCDGLLGKMVHNIYEDKNQNIWIAAEKGITVFKDGKIEKENTEYYLPGVSVTCIYEDVSALNDGSIGGKGNLVYWIATEGTGLKRLTLKDGIVTSYTTAHGMTSNFIYQFLEDLQGNFWLMSNSGILRVNKNELNRFAYSGVDKINCISFGISDGMKSLEFDNKFSRNSALKARNGEFHFITKKGISIVNPEKIRLNKTPPPVVIETVYFNRHPLHPPVDAEPVTFKGTTNVSFIFTAPTFLSPEKTKFKYQLEGSDQEWIYLLPGQERAAYYKDLAPGTYTFRVTACNAEGTWNQDGESLTFALKPSFYQTLLFKIAVLLLYTVLVAATFYIYKKKKHTIDNKAKYKGSPLNPYFTEECVTKLKYLMDIEKVYCDADISLQSLAEKMSIAPHQLSQLLNEKLNRNFADFINSYRIEEAKKILQSPRGARLKISSIAIEVGFSTMAAFYKAFKKHTNMTPSMFKKK